MSRVTFENYGRTAREVGDITVVSGRYPVQKTAQRLIVQDVALKMELRPCDTLLEIGCGPGNLLIPLSFMVAKAVGIDHPEVCSRLRARYVDPSIELIGMNFLDYSNAGGVLFDKVLIYSVINTLSDESEALVFADKAVSLLAPGGIALIGDIANRDLKARFVTSGPGKRFETEWRALQDSSDRHAQQEAEKIWEPDPRLYAPDDDFVCSAIRRYRKLGHYASVLPQPTSLPFGNTREDLIVKRAPD